EQQWQDRKRDPKMPRGRRGGRRFVPNAGTLSFPTTASSAGRRAHLNFRSAGRLSFVSLDVVRCARMHTQLKASLVLHGAIIVGMTLPGSGPALCISFAGVLNFVLH